MILFLLPFFTPSFGQLSSSFADSVRVKYKIPELAYAVVSSESILELKSLGVQRVNTNFKANINDRFRIGSNTKTITSYIAALLVKQEKIKWDTNFLIYTQNLKPKATQLITILRYKTF